MAAVIENEPPEMQEQMSSAVLAWKEANLASNTASCSEQTKSSMIKKTVILAERVAEVCIPDPSVVSSSAGTNPRS